MNRSVIFLLTDGRYHNAIATIVSWGVHSAHIGNVIGSWLESQVMRGTIVKTYYPGRHD